MGDDHEWLLIYCKEVEKEQHHDFYIFGHRHLMLDLTVNERSRYINLGEWVTKQAHQAYAAFDGKTLVLNQFK